MPVYQYPGAKELKKSIKDFSSEVAYEREFRPNRGSHKHRASELQ